LDDITISFPDIVISLVQVSGDFLMDGEIVPYKSEQILSFSELQKRLGRKKLTADILDSIPCRYFAFDFLFHNEEALLSMPLLQRRERLLRLQELEPSLFQLAFQRSVHTVEEIEMAFQDARARNNEGLVIKHPSSPYTPGKRGKAWLKLKRAMVTLDVVVTRAEYGHGKRAGSLSDYTFAVRNQGNLLNIGKAYSGISDEEILALTDLFHRISVRKEGYYHVVTPQVVLEVTFDRIQRSNRHSSGFALRFPRIKRIRWDKKVDEIDTLETVTHLYETYFK
jgi:DNA ligase-1